MLSKSVNAVVLAGDRGAEDPLLQHTNISNKAEIILGGITQLERVLIALSNARHIDQIFVVGPNKKQASENIYQLSSKYKAILVPMASGPSASAMQGLNASGSFPSLVLTCDLPLLTADHIDSYCQQIFKQSADFVIGAVHYELIASQFPELRKTIYRFSSDLVCFANIFAVNSVKGMKAVDFWREMEVLRKNPLQIIAKLGWKNILRYKLHRLKLTSVATILSEHVGAQVAIENIACAALAVDVDSIHDYEVMSSYLQRD
jgi:molybdopterin-guanine dinucleotide biosynthesis protein A